jgi:S1-C subfamily serine protease
VGDTILRVNGVEPGSDASLSDLIRKFEPGDVVQLALLRDGSEMVIEVKLGENPDNAGQAYLGIYFKPAFPGIPFDHGEEGFFFDEKPGFPFGHDDDHREMPFFNDEFPGMHRFDNFPEGIDQAIIIGEVLDGTPADEAGLRLEDLIIYIDGKTLDGVESFVENIQTHEPGEKVVLTVYRDGEIIEVDVILGEHPDNPDSGYLGVMVSGFIKVKVDGEMPENFEFDLEKELKSPGGDA